MPRTLFFAQPGCLSCELMRVYLEACEIPFEEYDISADSVARRTMMETYDSDETPTLVIFLEQSGTDSERLPEVVTGFDPVRLDQLFHATSSSDSVTEV